LKEFEIIAEVLAPLAQGQAALGLGDDAAVLAPPPGTELVLTKDAMVAGVHFRLGDPLDLVARKLLRVNLSDLAAMGAAPLGYLLMTAWPEGMEEAGIRAFAEGLRQDQESFSLQLLGGDTVRTPGPMTLSCTMLGTVPAGQALRRSGAAEGDDLWVSGTLGDASLGLELLEADSLSTDDERYLAGRYQLPAPHTTLGAALRGTASACIDISDGLVQDLGHILTRSGLNGARLTPESIPLSAAARAKGLEMRSALTWGDDYELLFTAPAGHRSQVEALSTPEVPLTRLGKVGGQGLWLGEERLDGPQGWSTLGALGWSHF